VAMRPFALVLLVTCSCGGQSERHDSAGGRGGAWNHPLGGSGGTGGMTGSCVEPPLAGAPSELGCYAHVDGGWRRGQCSCELWVKNPDPNWALVELTFMVTGGTAPPSLDAPESIEVAFDDPDSSWFNSWVLPANGERFSVTRDGATTIVRLGAAEVGLMARLSGCELRIGRAILNGTPIGQYLEMSAIIDAGSTMSSALGSCEEHPRP